MLFLQINQDLRNFDLRKVIKEHARVGINVQ